MVWLAVCSDVRALFRSVDVDGVDGVAGVDDVAAKRPRGPPRTSRSLAGLDASEGSNFKRFCSPAVEDGLLAAFGDDGAGRCEVSRPSSQPCSESCSVRQPRSAREVLQCSETIQTISVRP